MNGSQRRRQVGAEVLPDGSVHARVWAPYAERVTVVLEGGPGADAEISLAAEDRGYFSGILPGAASGTRYRFRLNDETLLADPASLWQPAGVHGPSAVADPAAFA